MAPVHTMVFPPKKPSTKDGKIRPSILFLAWLAAASYGHIMMDVRSAIHDGTTPCLRSATGAVAYPDGTRNQQPSIIIIIIM